MEWLQAQHSKAVKSVEDLPPDPFLRECAAKASTYKELITLFETAKDFLQ